jgi:hypothetical protein
MKQPARQEYRAFAATLRAAMERMPSQPQTSYERAVTKQLREASGDLPGTWVRLWPHPPQPGCHLFVGHDRRLPEIAAALQATGFVVVAPKAAAKPLERPSKGEVEVTRQP